MTLVLCRFVFEGKPPELKRDELAKRSTRREGANTDLEAAKEVEGGWHCGGLGRMAGWVSGWVVLGRQ